MGVAASPQTITFTCFNCRLPICHRLLRSLVKPRSGGLRVASWPCRLDTYTASPRLTSQPGNTQFRDSSLCPAASLRHNLQKRTLRLHLRVVTSVEGGTSRSASRAQLWYYPCDGVGGGPPWQPPPRRAVSALVSKGRAAPRRPAPPRPAVPGGAGRGGRAGATSRAGLWSARHSPARQCPRPAPTGGGGGGGGGEAGRGGAGRRGEPNSIIIHTLNIRMSYRKTI
ncbi:hypothetical protein E2C01_009764 [Portunus trituberculatus]|uniref:Uncharacterized protein n=1 Tax=Portunus trituberculatus TaxID=210409 RepID=A0A5B7D6N1_PORTR|nr:hypothetical protein [Portunus trituberculatus]